MEKIMKLNQELMEENINAEIRQVKQEEIKNEIITAVHKQLKTKIDVIKESQSIIE